ncbi:YggW family oxidoreductase [Salinivibrio sp. ML198]|uniref:radical SAM family heme chaperone HemW n=1 Tax=unclassified Salinivibrio TaxID=2636825 RepID=UPI000984A2BE|nr:MULTISPECIES: radical SAM family heme chaperone HemW [unclassified Salinivibrio]OOE68282.1 YggW family oxidoreductase [Salinivibrio sp. IB868]OOE73260.1 YggW family oxidoreductase [Salinivibrio sp. IB870]OOE78744.1 YggW family oxidoreductase [Salinivibrio sp. ML198]
MIPLSLYVHIPWCVQKCPYCDFNSHTQKGAIPEEDYIDALLDDLDADLTAYPSVITRTLHSIFIGGGTPSLMSPSQIARLLDGIKARLPVSKSMEVTMEANPGTVEADKFIGYRQAGVNRISIGVQSFSADKLERLGRIHGPGEAERAAHLAHQAGLNSFNLDLMHGLPEQSEQEALGDLEKAIALKPPHLSWYQLTIEPNTQFYSKPPTLPEEDTLWDIFDRGHQLLTDAGYVQYETSAYSLPDHQCAHNLNYWRFGDYLGIGCGAHGKLTLPNGDQPRLLRTVKVKHPRGYLDPQKAYLTDSQWVKQTDLAFEFFMNRFRLLEPCPKAEFVARTGLPLDHLNQPLAQAYDQGLLVESETHWQVTAKGKLFLNDLLAIFLAD